MPVGANPSTGLLAAFALERGLRGLLGQAAAATTSLVIGRVGGARVLITLLHRLGGALKLLLAREPERLTTKFLVRPRFVICSKTHCDDTHCRRGDAHLEHTQIFEGLFRGLRYSVRVIVVAHEQPVHLAVDLHRLRRRHRCWGPIFRADVAVLSIEGVSWNLRAGGKARLRRCGARVACSCEFDFTPVTR